MTSYLPCPPSISPPPALSSPQPHSQHVRSFDSYDSATPLLTAHPFICAAVAVFTVFAAMEKTAPEVAHPVHSFPITLLCCPHVRSSHGRLRHAGLWSHFSPPRPVIVLTGGWHGHNGPELLKTVRQERSAKYWHPPPSPPPLLPHSSLPCFDRWRQMWFSTLQRSLLNLIYRWIISCPDIFKSHGSIFICCLSTGVKGIFPPQRFAFLREIRFTNIIDTVATWSPQQASGGKSPFNVGLLWMCY